MSKSILISDRIRQVLNDHGVTREMIEKRVAEHRLRSRHLTVDLNVLTFPPGVVAAMLELVTEPRETDSGPVGAPDANHRAGRCDARNAAGRPMRRVRERHPLWAETPFGARCVTPKRSDGGRIAPGLGVAQRRRGHA